MRGMALCCALAMCLLGCAIALLGDPRAGSLIVFIGGISVPLAYVRGAK